MCEPHARTSNQVIEGASRIIGNIKVDALRLFFSQMLEILGRVISARNHKGQLAGLARQGIWFIVSAVALWPLVVASAFIFHGDPPPVIFILLWIVSGLFWACFIELMFIVKMRLWPNQIE